MLKHILKKFRGDKRAFTLVEILLAIALLAIATVTIGSIIVSTQNNSAQLFNESDLQQQLVEVKTALQNEILTTNGGIKFWVRDGNDDPWQMVDEDPGDHDGEKLLAFYNLDRQDFNLYRKYYLYNSDNKTIKVAEIKTSMEDKKGERDDVKIIIDTDIDNEFKKIQNWSTLASCVDEFSIDFSHYNDNKLVSYGIDIKQANTSYPADETIYLRNEIEINNDLSVDEFHVISLPKPSIRNVSFGYDSNEHGPTEINFVDRYWTRSEDTTLSATRAGTYTVTYILKDKDSMSWMDSNGQSRTDDITYTWSITPATVHLEWEKTSWVYDGKEHEAKCKVVGMLNGESCEPIYVDDSNIIGPNVTTKVCKVKLSNSDYALEVGKDVMTLKITTADPKVTINPVDHTYSGSAQSMVSYSGLTTNTKIYFYISTSSSTPSAANVDSEAKCEVTNAGNYHIWYKIVSNNSNYHDLGVQYLKSATHSNCSAVMNRAQTAVSPATAKAVTYKGSNYDVISDNLISGNGGSGFEYASGTRTAMNANTYTVKIKPTANHTWKDNGGTEERSVNWTINKANWDYNAIVSASNLTYNGSAQKLITSWKPKEVAANINGGKYGGNVYFRVSKAVDTLSKAEISGAATSWGTANSFPEKTDAAIYTVEYYVAGDSNHNQSATQSVNVTIAKSATAYANAQTYTFNGGQKTGVTGDFYGGYSGTMYATNAGKYDVTVYPGQNYAWKSGQKDKNGNTVTGSNGCALTWTIGKANGWCGAPTAKSLTYTGSAQVLVSAPTSYSGEVYYRVDSGSTTIVNWTKDINAVKATNAGDYTVYCYAAESTNYKKSGNVSTPVTIGRKAISKVPSQSGTLTYNGKSQSPSWNDYNTSQLTISGNTGTNAGPYTAYFTPTNNYKWWDNSTSAKPANWSISRAAGYVKLSATSGSITYGKTGTFTITSYTGSLSAASSNSNYATASLSGTTVTMTGKHAGSTTIVVTSAATTNYNAASATYTVTIGKATGSVTTAPTGKTGLEYKKDNSQSLLATNGSGTGTMLYSLGTASSPGTFSATIPTGTDAGTYYIWYKADASTNYTESAVAGPIVVTIKETGFYKGGQIVTIPGSKYHTTAANAIAGVTSHGGFADWNLCWITYFQDKNYNDLGRGPYYSNQYGSVAAIVSIEGPSGGATWCMRMNGIQHCAHTSAQRYHDGWNYVCTGGHTK